MVAGGCSPAVRAADNAIEVDEQVRQLDRALMVCADRQQLVNEIRKYPGLVGYEPKHFIEQRCAQSRDADVVTSNICGGTVASTTVAAAQVTMPEPTYTGRPIGQDDTNTVVLSPSMGVPFTDNVPTEVHITANSWITGGCEALLERRDQLTKRADAAPDDRPSAVFARHAQNLVQVKRCR